MPDLYVSPETVSGGQNTVVPLVSPRPPGFKVTEPLRTEEDGQEWKQIDSTSGLEKSKPAVLLL